MIIEDYASQWKMSFKQTEKLIFSRKTATIEHISLTFNVNYVQNATSEKHLGMILDSKLNFKEHTSQ